jgi:hypothetical protein
LLENVPQDEHFPELTRRQGLAAALRFLGESQGNLREFGRRHYAQQLLRGAGMSRAACEVTKAGERAGVPLLLLKGPTLAQTLYDDEGDRPYSDLDFWVRDVADANRLLVELGLRPYPNARTGLLFDIRRFKCTLHMELPPIDGGRYHMELHFLPQQPVIPEQQILSSNEWFTRPATRAGFPTLPTGALVLYLTLHLVHSHLGGRLLWYQDLAILLRQGLSEQDCSLLAEWGARTRSLRMLATVVERVEEYYGIRAQDEIRSLRPARRRRGCNPLRRLTSRENALFDFAGGTTSFFALSSIERTVANLSWMFSYQMLFDPGDRAMLLRLRDLGARWNVRFALHGTNLVRGSRAYRLCRALLLPIASYLMPPLAALFRCALALYLRRQARGFQ